MTQEPAVETIYLAAGCFWGVEEIYWSLPGVVATSVGYQGGTTPDPTYEAVCTGRTGHAEVVRVDYDPGRISTRDILRAFWEKHDPTQGNRQGNDVGTQYRSAIFTTTAEQRATALQTRDEFQTVIDERGYGPITTEIDDAADHRFWPAEEYHQRYLEKNPHGYRCHATTGLRLPTSSAHVPRPTIECAQSPASQGQVLMRELERVVDRLRSMPMTRLAPAADLAYATCLALLELAGDDHPLPRLADHAAGDQLAIVGGEALARHPGDEVVLARMHELLTELRRALP